MYSINRTDVETICRAVSPATPIPFTEVVNYLPEYVKIMPCSLKGFYGINTLSRAIIDTDSETGLYDNVYLDINTRYVYHIHDDKNIYNYSETYYGYANNHNLGTVYRDFLIDNNGLSYQASWTTYTSSGFLPKGRNISFPYGYKMQQMHGLFNTVERVEYYGDTTGPNTHQICLIPNSVTDVGEIFLTVPDSGAEVNKSKITFITKNKSLYDDIINRATPNTTMIGDPKIQFIPQGRTRAVAANAVEIRYMEDKTFNEEMVYNTYSVYTPTMHALASKLRPLLYLLTGQEKMQYGIDPQEMQYLTFNQIKNLILSNVAPRPVYLDINYLCGRLSNFTYYVGNYCQNCFDAGNYNYYSTDPYITVPSITCDNVTMLGAIFQPKPVYSPTSQYTIVYYRDCYRGSFLNTPNVITMSQTYNNSSISGPIHPTPKCTSLLYAYNGSGASGQIYLPQTLVSGVYAYSHTALSSIDTYSAPNLVNGYGMFYACTRLHLDHPLDSPKLHNMSEMYDLCYNLFGSPTMSDTVTNARNAYRYCNNLTGEPAFGESVTDVAGCYADCWKLTGPAKLPPHIAWLTDNGVGLYKNCYNLRGKPAVGPSGGSSMAYVYYGCNNLEGPPACDKTTKYTDYMYYDCNRMKGTPVCGSNVVSMSRMYYGCSNLTGRPACPDSVETASYAYGGCSNLTGRANIGANLKDMSGMYSGCSNLTGEPICTDKITTMSYAYSSCNNLTGNHVWGNKVTSYAHAYAFCNNLTGGYSFPNDIGQAGVFRYCNKKSGNINVNVTATSDLSYTFEGDKVTLPTEAHWKTLRQANYAFTECTSSSGANLSITINWNCRSLMWGEYMLDVPGGQLGGDLYLMDSQSGYYDVQDIYRDGKPVCGFTSIRRVRMDYDTKPYKEVMCKPLRIHVMRGCPVDNFFRNHFYPKEMVIEDADGYHYDNEYLQLYIKYY